MAFASITSVTETTFSSAAGSFAFNLPATINSGDLLLLLVSLQSEPDQDDENMTATDSTSDAWTELQDEYEGNRGQWGVWSKVADGDEDGGTVTVSIANQATAAGQVLRIINWYGSASGVEIGSIAFVQLSTNPNPPSLTASWGAEDNLWIAICHAIDDDATVSAAPSGYSGLDYAITGGGTNAGATIGHAYLENAAATENPGTFTISETENTGANTIVIRPAAAAGHIAAQVVAIQIGL